MHLSIEDLQIQRKFTYQQSNSDPCFFVGSTEAPSKVFLLFFLFSDWVKSNHLRSRIKRGFLDIFSRHICNAVIETIRVTNYVTSFGAKKCSAKTKFVAAEMILDPWSQQFLGYEAQILRCWGSLFRTLLSRQFLDDSELSKTATRFWRATCHISRNTLLLSSIQIIFKYPAELNSGTIEDLSNFLNIAFIFFCKCFIWQLNMTLLIFFWSPSATLLQLLILSDNVFGEIRRNLLCSKTSKLNQLWTIYFGPQPTESRNGW